MFRKFLSTFLAIAMLFSLSMSALAAENADTQFSDEEVSRMRTSFQKMSEIAENSTVVIDRQRMEEIKSFIKAEVEANEYIFNFGTATLDFERANLLDICVEDDLYTSITIPVIGEKYSTMSNVTFLMDKSEILTYTETLITRGADSKFVVDSYYNGNLVERNHTDIDYISNMEIEEGISELRESAQKGAEYAQTRGIDATGACLAAILGVNAAVGLLIASTCFASCPAVVPICVACISGVVAMGGADIAGVVACFSI